MTLTGTAHTRHLELEISFFLIIVLSGIYMAYDILAEPRGGHPFGHWLGIVGTILMVMTESLYSLRKRTRLLNWAGPVRHWLTFHIITGLIGPFLVLMHTGLQFRGLAGVTFGLTMVVVGSGFIGRYLYTSLQRHVRDSAQSSLEMSQQIETLQGHIHRLEQSRSERARHIAQDLQMRHHRRTAWSRWLYRRHLRQQLLLLERDIQNQHNQLTIWERRRQRLGQRAIQLAQTRRWFQVWHTVHIPIGVTLFAATAVHIAAAFFFRAGIFK